MLSDFTGRFRREYRQASTAKAISVLSGLFTSWHYGCGWFAVEVPCL